MKKQNLAQRLGQSIHARRVALGYSQDDFADRIDMHRAYYGIIERGVKNVTLPTLQRVCVGLGITMSELLRSIDE